MATNPTITRRRLLLGLPFAAAATVGVGFSVMLYRMHAGSFDPHNIRIPVLNKPVPEFSFAALRGIGKGFSNQDLYHITQPVLVNFFASWCIPCITENPALMALKAHLPIWGVAYKDQPDNTRNFLNHHGNPYTRIASDLEGISSLNWGLSGVPESFLILPGGIINWHMALPLTDKIIHTTLLPLLTQLTTKP
ncbi:redoxin domain-containing protein [Entomobacter blattae]|uniref:Thiol:disulfide interchange protein CycY n=1 Tax=Entomobacter blattae TaxID=2762277 RepID=A0A7H1NTH3_9PROT|nr:redoxin domain-containing protein [Entomobacter blattae]QNT79083.1 Thiol:disulfide interchange protein CycY [Entomobacter blattae]